MNIPDENFKRQESLHDGDPKKNLSDNDFRTTTTGCTTRFSTIYTCSKMRRLQDICNS